ncbi:MAG: ABC transporter permease [Phycisphaeraceae bacterium]|nr:ABC transporter permease [Phycisphaeraceae bacterium]
MSEVQTPSLPLDSDPARAASGPLGALVALWGREMRRFVRQPNRVIGALGTPLVFWLLLGSGLDKVFAAPGGEGGYLAYFFPGTLMLVVLFTAVFATISVIEDRRSGFLQAVLVAPVPRVVIAGGTVAGASTLAVGQAILLALAWPLVGDWPGVGQMAAVVGVLALVAITLSSLGLCLAWRSESTAGFHAIMNLLLMPMWFLSGAVFPFETAPGWQQAVMWINPLAYADTAVAGLLTGASGRGPVGWAPALMVTAALAPLALALAAWVVGRRPRGGRS